MPYPKQILSASGIKRALSRIAHEIAEKNESGQDVVMVGIQRGGVHLAARIAGELESIWGHAVPTGVLDVGMHRDDISRKLPTMHPTSIAYDLTGKTVVLVDDVLFSGRTVRAALDALNDFGRARRIQLAVLVDRGNRELPISPDFVGKEMVTALDERIEVGLKEEGGSDLVELRKV